MLTFLRRIRRSLIESGNARKYILYAIGEIALVVIGILIALQINNWNEWRKDRVRENEIMIDIADDIERNIALLENRIAGLEIQNQSCDIILDVIEKRLPYEDSLSRHFQLSRFGFGRAAALLSFKGYESLKSNGAHILLDKLLRDEIQELFETTYRLLEYVDSGFGQRNTSQAEVIRELFFQTNEGALIPFNHEKLFSENQYYSLLTELRANRKVVSFYSAQGLVESQRVLLLIKDELGETTYQ